MPFYFTTPVGDTSVPAPPSPSMPSVPPAPKTAAYTFSTIDNGVLVQFDTTAGNISGILPDPATVAGCTFMASKRDTSSNVVMITGPSFSHTLSDPGASVVIMPANGIYSVIADFTP